MKEIETVSIIGLGSIGCTLIPYLSKVLNFEHLRIIAGGARKTRLEKSGVTINNNHYKLNIVSPDIHCSTADLIVVAVKYNQLSQSINDIKNQVGSDTIIMSLMNGITSEKEIGKVYGMDKILYSLTTINALRKDDSITFKVGNNKIKFGEKGNKIYSKSVLAVKELFDKCGIPYEIPENMIRELWLKYLLNVSGNSIEALLGAEHIYFQKLNSANMARECIMREIIFLSKTMGTGLKDEDLVNMRHIYDNYSPKGKSSMLQDICAGRQSENEMFCGTAIRLGKENNVSMPATELLYYLLKTIDEKNAGKLDL